MIERRARSIVGTGRWQRTTHLRRNADCANRTGALAVRSSALVARGLRDLARDSNWLIKKVFTGRSPALGDFVGGAGVRDFHARASRNFTSRAVRHRIERSDDDAFGAGGNARQTPPETRFAAVFSWSPTRAIWWGVERMAGRTALVRSARQTLSGKARRIGIASRAIWRGRIRAIILSATSRGKRAALRVWEPHGGPPGGDAAMELATPDWLEPQQAGEEFAEEGSFKGYGRVAFSPNEEALASVIEIKGEWADDSIMVADVKKLSRRTVFGAARTRHRSHLDA